MNQRRENGRRMAAAVVMVLGCNAATPDDSGRVTDTARRDSVAVDSTSYADSLVIPSVSRSDSALPAFVPEAAAVAVAVPPVAVSIDGDELSVLASGLVIPVRGVAAGELRDTYGDPRTGHAHEALDIMAPRGTPVLSATRGRLLKLFTSVPGGIMVYAADSSNRFILMYGHLDRYADGLVENMPLERGQVIGYVGSTGNVPPGAPHLHFAIARGEPAVKWWKGDPVNPYPLLASRSGGGGKSR